LHRLAFALTTFQTRFERKIYNNWRSFGDEDEDEDVDEDEDEAGGCACGDV